MVTQQQIEMALQACDGKVQRAAKILGMARNNLYKSMARKGINPNRFRGNTVTRDTATHAVTEARVAQPTTPEDVVGPDPVSSSVILSAPPGPRTFRSVNATAPVTDDSQKPQLRLSRSVYLRPEQFKALDDACLDLPRVLREKLSPSKVMEKFLDDCFGEWLEAKLSPPPDRPASPVKPTRKERSK